ncbi:hypothetical protein F4677DRAFT_270910 [Hypoxylon crocopeplum]|nr:hypothetical protein F4677DRAFT_270910 [Hypoxylon crocopeplum]
MPAEANTQVRRSHRKSRNGCKECKRRHMKCDENRPTCANCNAAQRRCSYLDLYSSRSEIPGRAIDSHSERATLLSSPAPCAATTPSATTPSSITYPQQLPADSAEFATDGADDLPSSLLPPSGFDLHHLTLLHHLENEVLRSRTPWLVADVEGAQICYEAIFKSATAAPYLMDQMLAFSALHMSTLQSDGAEKAQHLREASKLQTRALGLFNASKPEVNEGNAVAMLVFCSFVGLHCLFDAVSSRGDFSDFLSKAVKYLSLHHGVHIIAHQGWQFLHQTELKQIINAIEDSEKNQPPHANAVHECDHVEDLLNQSRDKLGQQTYEACCNALHVLRWVFDSRRALPKPYPTHITLAWPIRITTEFIELLEQRQPVSLVILAHWAMLLHADREFWVFGDAGRFMIESLSHYLGRYWDEWLAVPKAALDSG